MQETAKMMCGGLAVTRPRGRDVANRFFGLKNSECVGGVEILQKDSKNDVRKLCCIKPSGFVVRGGLAVTRPRGRDVANVLKQKQRTRGGGSRICKKLSIPANHSNNSMRDV